MRRVLLVVVCFFAFVFPSISTAQETGDARPVKVATVVENDGRVTRSYPAVVLPSTETEVSFRVSGQVIELPIRAATEVEEGDIIAQIDPRDFERQVAQLESQRDQSAAQLQALRTGARAEEISALEAAVEAAQAQVDQAQEQAERTRQLADRGVVSTAQLDNDEAALRVAEATLRAEQEQLEIGRAGGRAEDIAAAEAALRGIEAQLAAAQDSLSDTSLRAPFAGIIARRDIENFNQVQAGQSVALLQDLSVVHLAFDVPGPDVTALVANGAAEIRNRVQIDGLSDPVIDAELVEFSVEADSATQTYRGRVAVPVPEASVILPGMIGNVALSAPGVGMGMSIPISAVGADSDGSPFVWVVKDDDTVEKRPVSLGDAFDDQVTVFDGVTVGDTVVTAGVSRLLDGMAVRPVTKIGG